MKKTTRTPHKDLKNWIHIDIALKRTTKISLSLAGFELAFQSNYAAVLPIEHIEPMCVLKDES